MIHHIKRNPPPGRTHGIAAYVKQCVRLFIVAHMDALLPAKGADIKQTVFRIQHLRGGFQQALL